MNKEELINNMSEIMNQLRWVCSEAGDWEMCRVCPFDMYCSAILDAGLDIPKNWKER